MTQAVDIRSECGVYRQMAAAAYHALPGASPSRLKAFLGRSPAHAALRINEPFEPSAEMILGTLGHHVLLEPDRPLPNIAIEPAQYPDEDRKPKPWNNNAKHCRDWHQVCRDTGVIALKRAEYAAIFGMAMAVSTHPIAAKLLEKGEGELSLVDYDETNKIVVRCRLDWVPPGLGLVDVKSTHDVRERELMKVAWNFGWHVQCAMNLDLWNSLCGSEQPKSEYRFIAVEQKPPHAVQVVRCTEEFIRAGRVAYRALLAIYAACIHSGEWPPYPPLETLLDVPPWHANKMETDY